MTENTPNITSRLCKTCGQVIIDPSLSVCYDDCVPAHLFEICSDCGQFHFVHANLNGSEVKLKPKTMVQGDLFNGFSTVQ